MVKTEDNIPAQPLLDLLDQRQTTLREKTTACPWRTSDFLIHMEIDLIRGTILEMMAKK